MADFKIYGTARGFTSWGFNGNGGGPNADFGNLFRNALPLYNLTSTLDVNDDPVLGASGSEIRTAGPTTFQYWFTDSVQSTNYDYDFTLTDTAGVYSFVSTAFKPCGDDFWCWAFESRNQAFVYQPGQYVKIKHLGSTENVFVFIGGQRLAGITGTVDAYQTVLLDTLGLTAGQAYTFKMFMVYRDPGGGGSKPTIETNFELEADDMIALSQWIIGQGTVTPAAGAYAPGSQTVTATPSAGYRLSTLTVAGAAHVSGSAYDFTTHTTIAATFEQTASPTAITRLKIIHRALRIIGVLTEGQLPSAAQVVTAKEALSCYIKALQDKGVKLWTEEWVAYPLNTASSTVLGTDGNYYQCIKAHTAAAANCPVTGASWSTYWMKTSTATTNVWVSGTAYTAINQFADTTADAVDQAFIRDVYGSDTDVEIIQTVTANEIPSKIDTGVPTKLWHVKDITSPYIYMWPIPDLLTYVLHYRRVRYLNDFTSDYASGDWPQSWIDAVVFGLAARLSFEYGVPMQEREELLATAERFEHVARGFNHERPTHHRFSSCY